MTVAPARASAVALILAALSCAAALAATKPSASPSPLLPGANSKEPISIEADKLNYYDKDQKAVYTGNVVAIQGDSRLTCSIMTIFLAKAETPAAVPPGGVAKAAAPPPPAASGAPSPGGSQVRHMDAAGPVTIVSKTQVATGDRGSYDKEQNKVWLFGNVTLSDDGGNVTKGDNLTYDLATGEAIIDGGRVSGVFIQGSGGAISEDNKPADQKKGVVANPKDKPKPGAKQAPPVAAAAKASGT